MRFPPPLPIQRRCQNQAHAAAFEPLTPFALYGSGKSVYVLYKITICLLTVAVGKDLNFAGAATPPFK